MAKISRRNFMRGAAVGTMGAAAAGLLTACGDKAASGSVRQLRFQHHRCSRFLRSFLCCFLRCDQALLPGRRQVRH